MQAPRMSRSSPARRVAMAARRDLALIGAIHAIEQWHSAGSRRDPEQRFSSSPTTAVRSAAAVAVCQLDARDVVLSGVGRRVLVSRMTPDHGQDGEAEHGQPEPGPDEAGCRSRVGTRGRRRMASRGVASCQPGLVRPFKRPADRPGMARNAHGRTGPLARDPSAGSAQPGRATTMSRSSVMSSMAQRTPSRPRPLSLTPP